MNLTAQDKNNVAYVFRPYNIIHKLNSAYDAIITNISTYKYINTIAANKIQSINYLTKKKRTKINK